jgi:hypothetical protein
MMTLFDIAVLIRAARLYLLAFEAVVICQTPVVVGKDLWIADLVDRTGQIVGSVISGDSAELPEGVLQACTETFVALREADRAGLPVGVAQDKVVQHMIEGNPVYSDTQRFHPGEV